MTLLPESCLHQFGLTQVTSGLQVSVSLFIKMKALDQQVSTKDIWQSLETIFVVTVAG